MVDPNPIEETGQFLRPDLAGALDEPAEVCRLPQHRTPAQAACPQITNSCVMIRFAQFDAGSMADQRMVQERRRIDPTEHSCQTYLAAGRAEEILPSDHEIDALLEVVHWYGELVCPVPEPVPQQYVTTLAEWFLLLFSQNSIGEPLHPHTWTAFATCPRCR
jgi:hypothetical protein